MPAMAIMTCHFVNALKLLLMLLSLNNQLVTNYLVVSNKLRVRLTKV